MFETIKNYYHSLLEDKMIREFAESISTENKNNFITLLNELKNKADLQKDAALLLSLAITETNDPFYLNELLNIPLSCNVADARGIYPLHKATETGNLDAIVLLLKHGADPDVADPDGVTSLHIANSFDGLGYISDILLNYGADPNKRDKLGKRYLM